MNDNMSPADVAAVVGNTDRNIGYGYPVFPYGGYGNNSGFGDGSSWLWLILILALMGGWGNGNGNGFGGGFNNDYAWLSNGQKEIMQNTNEGFNTLQLANQLSGITSGVQNLSTQLCNSTADLSQVISNGFANSETSANARQMANMQQVFGLSTQLADCCCENRLGIANLNSTILAENCADRAALAEGVRDIVTNQTANTQRILDQLCADKIDAKNEKISDLQREILMKDLQASQIQQTAELRLGQEREIDAMYNRLKDCPVGTVPVFGNQPIFTCSNNLNNGCGCGLGNTIV